MDATLRPSLRNHGLCGNRDEVGRVFGYNCRSTVSRPYVGNHPCIRRHRRHHRGPRIQTRARADAGLASLEPRVYLVPKPPSPTLSSTDPFQPLTCSRRNRSRPSSLAWLLGGRSRPDPTISGAAATCSRPGVPSGYKEGDFPGGPSRPGQAHLTLAGASQPASAAQGQFMIDCVPPISITPDERFARRGFR